MADIDKDSIMNILGNLLGEDKKETASQMVDAVSNAVSKPQEQERPKTGGTASLFDTNAIMGHMTDFMGKMNNAKNSREYSLLNAIRPYMRETRAPKIDSCLKIVQAISILNEYRNK
jgi:hypothetical protein